MASVEKYQLENGEPRYNVHWRAGARSMERSFRRAKDADAFRRHIETELANGGTVDPARGAMAFADYAEAWLAERRRADGRALAPRTKELYRRLLDDRLLPAFGHRRLNSIRTDDVRRWHSGQAERSGPMQAAKAYRLLRAVLNTAVEDERIAANPCRLRGARHERSPERPFVDAHIVLALSDAIEDRYRALVLLAGFGGLRLGELIDLAATTSTSTPAPSGSNARPSSWPAANDWRPHPRPTPASAPSTCHPPSPPRSAATRHLLPRHPDALVFTGPLSDGLRRATLYKAWDEARKQAGVDKLHLHDLRHAAGTLAAQTGATTRELMARLGHASPAAAHRYQHAAERRDVHIADALAAMLHTAGPVRDPSQKRADRRPRVGKL